MQDKSKILYESLSKVLTKLRQISGKNYLEFCDENSIATSTYDNMINAKTKATFYNVAKFVRGASLNFQEFGKLLDEQLPETFWEED